MKLARDFIVAIVEGAPTVELVLLEVAGVPRFPQEDQEGSITQLVRFVDEMHVLYRAMSTHFIPLPFPGVDLFAVHEQRPDLILSVPVTMPNVVFKVAFIDHPIREL